MISKRSLGWLVVLLLAGGILNPPFQHGLLQTALFLAAIVLLTVVRELGRLLVGLCVGLRPTIVEIGEGTSLLRVRAGGLLWHFKQTALSSATIWIPPPEGFPVRARLLAITLARPVVTLAVLLGIRALGVPLYGAAPSFKGGALLSAVVTASEALLLIGLFPFSIRDSSVVPFESDGLKLLRLPFAKPEDLAQEFARFYFATAFEALNDLDTARALAICREGLARFGPPWSNAFRSIEAVVLSRAGDHSGAQAKAEGDLARDLPPMARALALNSWSWFAFLRRDEADVRLADRRSADALILQPKIGAIAGTRGAILLWQGRVAEAIGLLERAHDQARSRRSRDLDACLLAMAHAARGEGARARAYLDGVREPQQTEGLWAEASRYVDAAQGPSQILHACRGNRRVVVGAAAVDLMEGERVAQRLAPSEINRVRVGVSARGRAQLLLRHDRGVWRLPLDTRELTWARMSIARVVRVPFADLEASAAPASDAASMETQERAYQERKLAQSLTVSTTKGVVFLASAIAFGASMLFLTSWRWLALVMPVLFVHELGHWIAMRAFGHDDARISFIPFLGAATMTKRPFERRWQEIVMLLAGPVPGIALGVAVLLSPLGKIETVRSVAVMLLAINATNLLPLHPLDGGRILHALFTAGRPRLDLAFKTIATLAFLAAGLKLKEPVLGGLGLFGLLFWQQGYRIAELERRIRRTPGFDPRLPATERRAYVFRALAADPSRKASDWAATVAGLEMPLAYRRSPTWQIVLGAGAFVLLGLGGVAFVARSVARRSTRFACPTRTLAAPVSCAGGPAFADVNWKTLESAAHGPVPARDGHQVDPPEDGASGDPFKMGAFVWCSMGNAAGAGELVTRLQEAEAGLGYCEALPWEHPASGSEDTRRKARWTQWTLRYAGSYGGSKGNERYDRFVAAIDQSPKFDPETARLLREIGVTNAARPPVVGEAQVARYKELGARLGRSPDASCERLRIHNVQAPEPGDGAAQVVTFSVTMTGPAEFAALAGYLCQTGCSLAVLPARPEDRRLDFCF